MNIKLNYIEKFSSHHKVNTNFLHYKTHYGSVVAYREIIAVCSEISIEHRNTPFGLNERLFNVTGDGTKLTHNFEQGTIKCMLNKCECDIDWTSLTLYGFDDSYSLHIIYTSNLVNKANLVHNFS
jgi:hypothetical protein